MKNKFPHLIKQILQLVISRRLCLLAITFSFAGVINAQNTETDSLKNVLNSARDDAKRVVVLEGLSYAYLSSYPDTALQYALEGLQLAQDIGDIKGEALCTNALGNVYFHAADYPKALEMYFRYLQIKESSKNWNNLAVAYFNIADVYTEEEDYQHALYYIFKAKGEDEKIKDTAGILFDLYSLGNIYLRMQKADSSLYYIQQSYKLAQTLQDKNMIGAILNSFGETYALLKNDTLATRYYSLSIPYTLAVKDYEVLSSDYYGLAKIFEQKKELDSAVYYARKAILISKEARFLKQVLETSTFLANVFKSKKQFDSAFHYQELSIATNDSLFNVEKIRKVQSLKFQEQQRQQAIKTARTELRNKIKLYIVFFVSAIFLITAIVLWRNNKQKQKAYALLQQQKTKTEEAYEELKATQAQLIQSEKMASLGELTAGIAHEIQNPLNFVNNFSDVNSELIDELQKELNTGDIQEAISISKDIKENEQKILHHGRRADAIVKGMLQHSRSSTSQKEPVDINALADEYVRLTYHGLRAKDKAFNATIQTDYDKNLAPVYVIPQDIGRVFLNVLTNAFYSVNEKKKQFPGEEVSYEPTVFVSTKAVKLSPDDLGIIISIKDNGLGIPQKILDKIFQPFFTTKPTGQGTGLGLSLSYDIVKAHGGEIKIDTKEGEGAEFIIELPL